MRAHKKCCQECPNGLFGATGTMRERTRGESYLHARCKQVASQVLGRCLGILFVFSSYSLRVVLLFSAEAAHLTPWRPRWSQGGSSKPMSSFDRTGSAAIQMKSHFRINLLPLAVRLPRPALPGLTTPYAAGQARRFRVDQICFPFMPHRSRICRCSLTLCFPWRDYRSVRYANPGNSQLEVAYSHGVGSQSICAPEPSLWPRALPPLPRPLIRSKSCRRNTSG